MHVVEIKTVLPTLEHLRLWCRPPACPAFDGLAQVRAYWEGLRQGSALPERLALDPRGLSGVLDRVFLAERIDTGLAWFRIAGSGLAGLAGMELRGLPLSCLFAAESRSALALTVERAFTGPATAEIDLGADRGRTGIPVARLLLLPLADEGVHPVLLGAIGFGQNLPQPCRFQILARREERLGLPYTETGEVPPTRPARRSGHLALVHSSG